MDLERLFEEVLRETHFNDDEKIVDGLLAAGEEAVNMLTSIVQDKTYKNCAVMVCKDESGSSYFLLEPSRTRDKLHVNMYDYHYCFEKSMSFNAKSIAKGLSTYFDYNDKVCLAFNASDPNFLPDGKLYDKSFKKNYWDI